MNPRLSGAALAIVLSASALGTAAPSWSAPVPAMRTARSHTVLVAAAASSASTPSMSKNGRFLAYQTGDSSDSQIALWYSGTGATTIVSTADGHPANGTSFGPSISSDGRFVAYLTDSSEILGATPPAGQHAIVLWDRVADTTSVVAGPGAYTSPVVSSGGAFVSYATYGPEGNQVTYLWDRSTAAARLVTTSGTTDSGPAGISDNGRYLLLSEEYSDSDGKVLWDRKTGKARRIPTAFGARLSGDGKVVAVDRYRKVRGKKIPTPSIWKRTSGRVTRLRFPARLHSLLKDGAYVSAISDNGRYVTVITNESGKSGEQVLLADRKTGKVTLTSRTQTGSRDRRVIATTVSKRGNAVAFADHTSTDPHAGALRIWRRAASGD